ncbi:uncharacterized protein [Euwallacea similis]|uniref:uncharacterized protein n=1 Tax=Euwallacea similis TaxID=1736056 RepID=UPI00344CD47A
MFGSKLRAWMEAVRPKKKQHRKEKQVKSAATINERPSNNHTVTWKSSCLLNCEKKEGSKAPSLNKYVKSTSNEKDNGGEQVSRYSANNLSSPESAYSTGYSTDGTSPGGVPPDYPMNSSDKTFASENTIVNRLNPDVKSQLPCTSRTFQRFPEQPSPVPTATPLVKLKQRAPLEEKEPRSVPANPSVFFGKLPDPPGVVSPRQRNRIRTNPWLPGGSSSNIASPLPMRQDVKITPLSYRKSTRNSPIHYKYLSPVMHKRSLSSSSCSSISAGPTHSFEHRVPRSLSDEDDCTLNEMMGKYDESYVYEKETDILSDSDPTDCESDIDTGQDGGDEEDNGDEELDFIDNGSYLEIDSKTDNTGHCMYIINSDTQRRRSSRRRTMRRCKEANDRRRRTSSNKKHQKHLSERSGSRHSSLHQDGSKSAGATPVSVRRLNQRSNQYKIQEESIKRRSNSVCLHRDVTVLIEKRDREADLKYKELIGQAEQIIRTMNVNGLSPRRVPGPTNKRVELLRSAECAKSDVLFMNKSNEEALTSNSNNSPSTVMFKNTRFSPKKNHITNFIINNSPVLVRKENQRMSPIMAKRSGLAPDQSPLTIQRQSHQLNEEFLKGFNDGGSQPLLKTEGSKKKIKSILHKTEPNSAVLLSPRHRREIECPAASSSSDEEGLQEFKKKLSKSCPQSEPVRRKIYFGRNTINIARNHGKTVVFNLSKDMPNDSFENKVLSSENLRHQVLLNTIQSLKRNLEDHSASLQQTYHQKTYIYKH